MKRRTAFWLWLWRAGVIAALSVCVTMPAVSGATAVDSLLSGLPAQNSREFAEIMTQLVQLGPAAIEQLCADLSAEDSERATRVRYALSGLAKHATRPNATREHGMIAGAYARALARLSDKEAQAFLIEQLQLMGHEDSVSTLSSFLMDDRLGTDACRALASIGGRRAEDSLIRALESAPDENAAAIVATLGRLRCRRAVPALHARVDSRCAATRNAALWALANIGDSSSQSLFTTRLASTATGYEHAKVAELTLLYARRLAESRRARQAKAFCDVILEAPGEQSSAHVRCAVLSLLVSIEGKGAVSRLLDAVDSEDIEYRAGALQLAEPIGGRWVTQKWVRKSVQARPELRAEIVAMLGRRGDRRAAPAVLNALTDDAPDVRMAAVDAAARLAGPDAVAPLVGLLETERHAGVLNMAKEGLLRLPAEPVTEHLAGALLKLPPESKIVALEVLGAREATQHLDLVRAMAEDQDPAVRASALRALGSVGEEGELPRLLGILAAAASEDETKAAGAAILAIASRLDDVDRRLAPIHKALGNADGESWDRLHRILVEVCALPDSEGFVRLFNGVDLTGWVGDTEGYVVENGVLVCRPGGNLYTEGEFGDFVFRFEFKLTPGGNNGLAVRAPVGGGAYNGMEIQILDDSAEQYANLKPWQYHGSIYGIVPAKRGHLRPVGEWNTEEVVAKGRRITVKLNGAVIVDANLDEAVTPQPMDGKAHEGLDREKGHLGFLGHGTVVAFRNIRIKELR